MSTTGKAFRRVITVGQGGFAGDAEPVGRLEVNDGVSLGRAWAMSDFPGPGETFAIGGTVTSTQVGPTFTLILWVEGPRGVWSRVLPAVAGVASGASFRFGAIADAEVFIQVTPSTVILEGQTVTLVLTLGTDEQETDATNYLERIVGDPTVKPNHGILYTKDVVGLTELFYRSDAGLVTQLTPSGAMGVSGWTRDAAPALVRLSTVTDPVAIGAGAMFGGEKLRLVGDFRNEGSARITGNLTVDGTVTFNSSTIDFADRVVHFNHSTGVMPIPASISGVGIHRGATAGPVDRDHAALLWTSDSDVVDPSTGTGFWRFSSQTGGDDITVGADLDAQARMLRVSRTAGIGIRFETDNSADIGAAGVTRPRTGYFGTSVVIAGTVTISTDMVLGSAALDLRATAATLTCEATGANAITFRQNGAERARFHTNGFFGVGTAAPASALVDVVRPAGLVATDAGIRITDANLSAGRTTNLFDLSDSNSGAGHSIEIQRTAGAGAGLSISYAGTATAAVVTRTTAGTAFRASTPVAGGIAVRAQGLAAGDVVLDLGLTDGSTTARFLGVGQFVPGVANTGEIGTDALRWNRMRATSGVFDNTTLTGGLTRNMTNGEGVVIDAFRAVQIVPGTFQVARTLATALSTTDLFGFAQASIGIAASGQCLYDGVTSAQFETGLVLNEGDRVYLSRTVAGALTNTVAAFLAGDVVAEVGILVDDSVYVGTLLSNSIASVFIQVKTPTVL